MIGGRAVMGEAVAVDRQTFSGQSTAVDAERLARLIKPLVERCDRLARSGQDHPTVEVSQARFSLHQALINLSVVGGPSGAPRVVRRR